MPITTSVEQDDEPQPGLLSRWTLDLHNRTVLFRLGNWLFTTYSFLAGTAVATGFAVMLWVAQMQGLDAVLLSKLYAFVLIPGVLVGLRAFSVMLEWRELLRRPLATLIKPGYMLHGGLAGGALAMVAISSISGIPLLRILDGPALALPLGEAIARLGCYVYGCCWGRPVRGRWADRFGVRYTSGDSKIVRCAPHLENVRIHPAQLYALVVYAAMFAVFYALLPYMPFDGAMTGMYLIGHSVLRISLEHFREDDRGRLWGKVTHTNLYSIVMILAGALALAHGYQFGAHTTMNTQVRLVHILGDGSMLPMLGLCWLIFAFAYGVHYKKVGSWLSRSGS